VLGCAASEQRPIKRNRNQPGHPEPAARGSISGPSIIERDRRGSVRPILIGDAFTIAKEKQASDAGGDGERTSRLPRIWSRRTEINDDIAPIYSSNNGCCNIGYGKLAGACRIPPRQSNPDVRHR
jgi:hypothetical protein